MTTLSISIPRPVHPTGVWGWITTIDHKRIGILYGVTAFVLFVMGGVEALIMRTQLARAELELVSPETFNQLFTMHGTTMIFLAIMPMGAAFFNYLIPLQIGARRCRLPALKRLQLLDLPRGRDHAQRELVPRRGAERRLVRLRSDYRRGLQPRPRHRLLDHEPPVTGHRVAGGRLQLHRHDTQHEGPRHDADAHAAVHLDDSHNSLPAGAGVPGHHGRP